MRNPFNIFFPGRRPRKRDYSPASSQSSNPMFRQAERSGRFSWYVLLIVLVLGGAGTYALSSSRFRITEVSSQGTQKLEAGSVTAFVHQELNRTFLGIAWRRVNFLVPTSQLATAVKRAAGQLVPLSSVAIEKTGPHSLIVRITEQVPNFLWARSDGQRYFIDEQGIVIEPAPDTLIQDLPTIIDANDLPADPGERVVDRSVLEASRVVRDRLSSLNLTATSFSTWPAECPDPIIPIEKPVSNTNSDDPVSPLTDSSALIVTPECDPDEVAINERSFVVTTTEGWDIRLTAANDINRQLDKLSTALAERLTSRNQLEYVDVRFGDRVFFQ